LRQIAKDFGISESCLHRWLNVADTDDWIRPGTTTDDNAELHELRKHSNRNTRSCAEPRRTSPR
jgi:transposase